MFKVSVTNVQKSGLQFSADVKVWWENDKENVQSFHAHTNRRGEGLWTGHKQTYGTSQFSVRTKAAFRAAIMRAFK